MKGVLSR